MGDRLKIRCNKVLFHAHDREWLAPGSSFIEIMNRPVRQSLEIANQFLPTWILDADNHGNGRMANGLDMLLRSMSNALDFETIGQREK